MDKEKELEREREKEGKRQYVKGNWERGTGKQRKNELERVLDTYRRNES